MPSSDRNAGEIQVRGNLVTGSYTLCPDCQGKRYNPEKDELHLDLARAAAGWALPLFDVVGVLVSIDNRRSSQTHGGAGRDSEMPPMRDRQTMARRVRGAWGNPQHAHSVDKLRVVLV